MTTAMSSASDGRSLEEVKRTQMDRLDEMQKLDGDVMGLNSAYIDILDRVTEKLDLLANLADEIEKDSLLYPASMDESLKMRLDLINQSGLMHRYMCTKAVFQHALQAIQAMNQFGCDYMQNGLLGAPFQPSTSENISQPRHSDVSGDTLASDSDATVAARMDVSDCQLSIMDEGVVSTAGPSTSVQPQSFDAPSTIQFEEEESIKAFLAKEMEEIRREEEQEAACIAMVDTPPLEITRDASESAVTSTSALSQSLESMEEKRKKKKKKKKGIHSKEKRRHEAHEMENILNKHLKRSREKQPNISKEDKRNKEPRAPSPSSKDIEKRKEDDDDNSQLEQKDTNDRIIADSTTSAENENRENERSTKDEGREVQKETENKSVYGSNQVLSIISHPNVRCSTLSISSMSYPIPQPVPPPILPSALGKGCGFVVADMKEAPITPSNWPALNEEKTVIDHDSSVSDKSVLTDRPESRDGFGGERQGRQKRRESRCESRGSLKERLEEEIRLRESGQFSPERRGRSRSHSYSPRRRSRSRSRERRDYRWNGPRFRYGYRPRFRRYSRSPTRSRSPRSRSRSRHRSYSRDRDESRYRSMSRSRSRSRTRSRSVSKERSITPVSSPNGKNAGFPMPRSYARFRNRSNERKEKKKEEKKGKEDENGVVEEDIISNGADVDNQKSPCDTSSILVPPPPTPPVITLPTSSRSHSTSPSIFIPPPPIRIPHKPPTLKISIPSTLPKGKSSGVSTPLSTASSLSLVSVAGTPSSSSTSLIRHSKDSVKAKEGILMNGCTEKNKGTGSSSLSSMSLEGNTISEGSNGDEKRKGNGGEALSAIPTPPLSNPSSMETRKSTEIDDCCVPLPPPPPFPPLPSESNVSRPPIYSPVNGHSMGVNRASSSRPLNGPVPIYPLVGGPHHSQYYSNTNVHNSYGPHYSWMNQDPQWQQSWQHYHNMDHSMMGGGGFGNSVGPQHTSPITQNPIPETHGSFIKAMRVIPCPLNEVPPPDWGQMARDHANQQMHLANAPPPPPHNLQGHMMGHPQYGTPQVGRGGSRFRGGGGNGRRW